MKVTIYTTNCPQCKALEAMLTRNKISFNKCEDIGVMLEMGMQSSPFLDVDGVLMNYGQAIKWIKEVAN